MDLDESTDEQERPELTPTDLEETVADELTQCLEIVHSLNDFGNEKCHTIDIVWRIDGSPISNAQMLHDILVKDAAVRLVYKHIAETKTHICLMVVQDLRAYLQRPELVRRCSEYLVDKSQISNFLAPGCSPQDATESESVAFEVYTFAVSSTVSRLKCYQRAKLFLNYLFQMFGKESIDEEEKQDNSETETEAEADLAVAPEIAEEPTEPKERKSKPKPNGKSAQSAKTTVKEAVSGKEEKKAETVPAALVAAEDENGAVTAAERRRRRQARLKRRIEADASEDVSGAETQQAQEFMGDFGPVKEDAPTSHIRVDADSMDSKKKERQQEPAGDPASLSLGDSQMSQSLVPPTAPKATSSSPARKKAKLSAESSQSVAVSVEKPVPVQAPPAAQPSKTNGAGSGSGAAPANAPAKPARVPNPLAAFVRSGKDSKEHTEESKAVIAARLRAEKDKEATVCCHGCGIAHYKDKFTPCADKHWCISCLPKVQKCVVPGCKRPTAIIYKYDGPNKKLPDPLWGCCMTHVENFKCKCGQLKYRDFKTRQLFSLCCSGEKPSLLYDSEDGE